MVGLCLSSLLTPGSHLPLPGLWGHRVGGASTFMSRWRMLWLCR